MTLTISIDDTELKLRKVQPEEFAQLAKDVASAEDWNVFKKWATALYGNGAATVEVEYSSEYNDEGGYYLIITHTHVSDKNGDQLYVTKDSPIFLDPKWMDHYDTKNMAEGLNEAEKDGIANYESDYEEHELISEFGWDRSNANEDAAETFDLTVPNGLPDIYVRV